MIALFGDVRARLRRAGYACARRGRLLRDRALLSPEKDEGMSVDDRRQTTDDTSITQTSDAHTKKCCYWRASTGSNFFKAASSNPTGLRAYPHPALARHLLPMGEGFKMQGDEALSR
ncbi:hypothetical protein [Xanthomonas sp. MLO165]|uniref:hypothetical protein n=1 Tax=Xanthomonas sp. MLO165 TaxID=2081477 RepID=UPI001C042EFB|nr:hypothetical protein [Xanthomonas sp. MLO165]